jgi:hypothetical protein
VTNLSQDARREAGALDAHPQEVIAVARIIKRMGERDPEIRNRMAVKLAEHLAEIGHRFNEPALLAMCGFDPKVGGAP